MMMRGFAPLLMLAIRALAEGSDPMIITKDTVLEKGAVLREALIIAADHVTLDGNGATIQGPGRAGDPRSFAGVGLRVEGCRGVTIRNLTVRGFEIGFEGRDGDAWKVEGCDFSDNYTDPEFGWGEHKRVGGMILTRVRRSVFRGNRANRVWNGLDLDRCDDNLIERNDLSHCSNVCLRMWTACRNRVIENNLSYGIRIKPGEVHARDSAGVLIESGSHDNYFCRNDITHGGDGIFIRVLNGWVSTGNIFVENDTSHANNNCVESWSPGNVYIRNKANHGSYGFWLGGSDQTVLIGNEAAYNGQPDGPHNAPEPGFGHGGIVIVGGASSHTILDGNWCHHNHGGGIVFRGDVPSKGRAWRTHHWIVQNNRIEANRFGIWGMYGDWIHLAGNRMTDNGQDRYFEDVTNLSEMKGEAGVARAPVAVVRGPSRASVGRPVVFDASASYDPAGRPLRFRWDLGDGTSEEARVEHTYGKPGFYRVGVTVSNGVLADLGFRDLIVTEDVAREYGTEGEAARWGFEMQGNEDGQGRVIFADDPDAVVGRSSLRWRPDPYKGMYATAIYPGSRDADWDLSGKTRISFWLKATNPNIPGFQEAGPVVRLYGKTGQIQIQPAGGKNLLAGVPFSEARWTWMRIVVPLAGDGEWSREQTGEVDLKHIRALSLSFDSWGGDPFTIWIDGLAFE